MLELATVLHMPWWLMSMVAVVVSEQAAGDESCDHNSQEKEDCFTKHETLPFERH